ncbi:MAG: flagellar basal body L-ring protein FlgH [bacterium]
MTSSLAILRFSTVALSTVAFSIVALPNFAQAADGAAASAKSTANAGSVGATSSADAPVSAPKSAPKRVLRDDEKPAAIPTRSLVAQAVLSQDPAQVDRRGQPVNEPGSLFAVQEPEPRAFAVHDLVTIVISESSRSKSASDAKADKDYEMSAAVDAWISMDPTAFGDGFFTPIDSGDLPEVGVSGEKSFKGKGSYARSDDFTARVTAEIVEVRPNGLLVLEARREIVNDGESQIITLSGICRPEDIDANNQVISQRVADAVVKKLTTGELRDTAEKGVLAKLIDTIFAF